MKPGISCMVPEVSDRSQWGNNHFCQGPQSSSSFAWRVC